ncbi:MAG: hypothetical protein ACRED5_22955 [Propylenella sp.]
MNRSFAGALGIVAAVLVFSASGGPARAQDPQPPLQDRHEANETLGALPFTAGQPFTYDVPKSIPNSTNNMLVTATFTCSLISGQIQDGLLVQWTIWTPVQLPNGNPGKASFQLILWCAPGQLTTSQASDWLPITAASRTVFAQLDTTGQIPWDKTQSVIKIVSYR